MGISDRNQSHPRPLNDLFVYFLHNFHPSHPNQELLSIRILSMEASLLLSEAFLVLFASLLSSLFHLRALFSLVDHAFSSLELRDVFHLVYHIFRAAIILKWFEFYRAYGWKRQIVQIFLRMILQGNHKQPSIYWKNQEYYTYNRCRGRHKKGSI